MVDYARVKAHIIELLDEEVPDREIAARVGVSAGGFYKLKVRILKEVIAPDIALNVAAREYMRLDKQMKQLVTYLDQCWLTGIAPDANYITAFTNLSRRLADLVGANAAIAITIDHGDDDEASQNLRDHQLDMAKQLNRFYELQDRLTNGTGQPGIGSGMTAEERDRELANLQAAIGEGEVLKPEDYGLTDTAHDTTLDDDSPDIEDAVELIELDGVPGEDHWEDPPDGEERELIEIPRDKGKIVDLHRRYQRECAANAGDAETSGRWVNGKFVSWWHDNGDNGDPQHDDFSTFDMDIDVTEPLGNDLDGPPDD